MSNTVLAVENVSKSYRQETALRNFSLDLDSSEILTLIGPSGCGKTTALRIIAGLERPDQGIVRLNDRVVSGQGSFVRPEDRNVGFVFQDLALFPHLTVEENVAYGLTNAEPKRQERLDEIIDLVGLDEYRQRYPENLSGGQKQRVALARSLVVRPSVLLMDEPFSNLDKGLRNQLRFDVRKILRRVDIPTIFVTHDQEEALFLGDRTAVMSKGQIEQTGDPQEIVTHPRNRFVAEFLGPTEFIPARKTNGHVETEFDTFPVDQVKGVNDDEFELMVRGDDIKIQEAREDGMTKDGIIEDAEFLGGFFRYKIRLNSGRTIYSLLNHSQELSNGTPVRVHIQPGHELIGFDKSTESV